MMYLHSSMDRLKVKTPLSIKNAVFNLHSSMDRLKVAALAVGQIWD